MLEGEGAGRRRVGEDGGVEIACEGGLQLCIALGLHLDLRPEPREAANKAFYDTMASWHEMGEAIQLEAASARFPKHEI